MAAGRTQGGVFSGLFHFKKKVSVNNVPKQRVWMKCPHCWHWDWHDRLPEHKQWKHGIESVEVRHALQYSCSRSSGDGFREQKVIFRAWKRDDYGRKIGPSGSACVLGLYMSPWMLLTDQGPGSTVLKRASAPLADALCLRFCHCWKTTRQNKATTRRCRKRCNALSIKRLADGVPSSPPQQFLAIKWV